MLFYMNCEIFYFPKIANTKFNAQKQPQKQFLFKNIIKMINDLKQYYSVAEFIGYIKAQFEIMKLNSKYDPLIAPNMLHGKKQNIDMLIGCNSLLINKLWKLVVNQNYQQNISII